MADESVFIVDIGSSSVKAGFSGEDIPSYVFPSAMTKIPQKYEEVSGLFRPLLSKLCD